MSTLKRLSTVDLLTGLALLLLAVALFWASLGVKDFAAIGVGSAFVPRLTAAGLALVAMVLLGSALHRQGEAPAETTDDASEPRVFGGLPAVATSAARMAGYLALLEPLGFLPASALYVFLQMIVLSKHNARRYGLFALCSLLPAIAFYYLFVNLFDISLPAGILG